MLFDTHVHLIDRQRLSYPWLKSEPALNQDASYDDYLRNARQLGIRQSFHMEVNVADEDIENESLFIKELMDRDDSQLVGAISACFPESETFPTFLERQRERSWIKGFRRVLHVVDDEMSRGSVFRKHVNMLAATDYVFDICARADQLSIMVELVDACPNVQFVLDHCGVPDIKGGALTDWKKSISDIAKRPNVAVKISGVIAYGNGLDWTLDDIRPYVEHSVEAFGWDRVVWGSDSPVCIRICVRARTCSSLFQKCTKNLAYVIV